MYGGAVEALDRTVISTPIASSGVMMSAKMTAPVHPVAAGPAAASVLPQRRGWTPPPESCVAP